MANTKKNATTQAKSKDALKDVLNEDAPKTELNFETKRTERVNISDSALINIKSNTFGELFVIDPITHEEISFPECGYVQTVTMGFLRHLKTGAVKFYSNQLIVIVGFADENADKYTVEDIYNALFISQYYKDFLDPADYEMICAWTPEEIRQKVPALSAGAKQKLLVAVNTYIEKGLLDSLKAIKTFEEVLGCELRGLE